MKRLDRILALRFLRLPPASVPLGVPFGIAITLADDFGTPIPDYGELSLRIACLSTASDARPLEDYVVVQAGAGAKASPSPFKIASGGSTFHTFQLEFRRSGSRITSGRVEPSSFRLCVELDPASSALAAELDEDSRNVLTLAGETAFAELDEYGDTLVLKCCSGSVAIHPKAIAISKEKVKTSEVLLWPKPGSAPIRTIEHPSMHVIGDHLWHCSPVLAAYLIRHSDLPGNTGPSASIIDLGAGCGQISLAVASILGGRSGQRILATDLLEIVESTLAESIAANKSLSKHIELQALEWGKGLLSLPNGFIKNAQQQSLIILASDVLYNRDSHGVFLQTLLRLFEAVDGNAKAIVAYKHRVQGDSDFFDLAERAGLHFELLYEVAAIQLWSCDSLLAATPST